MKNFLKMLLLLLITTSCSNWKYKNVEYERCEYFEKQHVHLYHHDSCEWYCLNFEEGNYTFEDTFKIKYKTDKKGKVKKVKLVK
jgi:uncharacterized protein YxeA